MSKKDIVIPELEECVNRTPTAYVKAERLCYTYSLRYYEIKKVARECGAFKMMHRQSFIDVNRFDQYVRSLFGEEDSMKRKEMNEPELCNEVNNGTRKYVRYREGAGIYSLGLRKFTELAKEADTVRKVGVVTLVSIEKLNAYIENNS